MDVLQECQVDDYQDHETVSPNSLCSIQGTYVVREADRQDSSNVQAQEHVARSLDQYVEEISPKGQTALDSRTAEIRPCTRRLCKIDSEDMEVKETMELELQMDSCAFIKAPKEPHQKICDDQWQRENFSKDHKKKNKTVFACKREAHE